MSARSAATPETGQTQLFDETRCAFCGAGRGNTDLIIYGPGAIICSGCVMTCVDIIKLAKKRGRFYGAYGWASIGYSNCKGSEG